MSAPGNSMFSGRGADGVATPRIPMVHPPNGRDPSFKASESYPCAGRQGFETSYQSPPAGPKSQSGVWQTVRKFREWPRLRHCGNEEARAGDRRVGRGRLAPGEAENPAQKKGVRNGLRNSDSGPAVPGLQKVRNAGAAGVAWSVPIYSRGSAHDVPGQVVDDAPVRGFRQSRQYQSAVQVPDRARNDRTFNGFRYAGADGVRRGPPDEPRRSWQRRGSRFFAQGLRDPL